MKCPRCDGTGEIALEGARFGDLLLAHRKAKGMTQQQLAEDASISRAQVANLERGGSDVRLRTLQRFATALGVSAKDLIP